MKLLLPLVLVLSNLAVTGQNMHISESKKLYTPKELREDYSILRKALETTYPSLYRFTDSLSITNYLDSQVKLFNRPITEIEFYKYVALTCARTNDEHVIPTPSQDYYQELE